MSLPLPELTAYRLPDISPAAATSADFLAALASGLGSPVDYRGVTIPGSHLWAVTGVTEAVYAKKPTGSPMIDPAVLFAAAASAGSATFQTDSFFANSTFVGIAKNAGVYSAWNTAAPFTSGQWSGFNLAFYSTANVTGAVIRPYVTQETIILDVWTSATGHFFVDVGAVVEAYTDHIDACESDSRLYGCFTGGGSSPASTNLLVTISQFLDHTIGNSGTAHGYVFEPYTANIRTCGRTHRLAEAPVAGNEVDETGAYVFGEVHIARSVASNVQSGKRTGKLRGIYIGGLIQGARTRQNALGEDLFHVLGRDSGADGQAYVIRAAP